MLEALSREGDKSLRFENSRDVVSIPLDTGCWLILSILTIHQMHLSIQPCWQCLKVLVHFTLLTETDITIVVLSRATLILTVTIASPLIVSDPLTVLILGVCAPLIVLLDAF